jgi:GTP-binding protein
MKIRSAQFIHSAADSGNCPEWAHPEIAFIGRSNVGKSSLINLLTHRRELAKVSATPGKTRLLNFFLINDSWSIVDLPGYGYAKVAKSEKMDFNELVGDYLEQRPNLAHVFVLIDARHKPQAIDLEFIRWLCGTGARFSLVFTKADKQSAAKNRASIEAFQAAIAGWRPQPPRAFLCSSSARTGHTEVLGYIDEILSGRA